jgi:hypothetical protein
MSSEEEESDDSQMNEDLDREFDEMGYEIRLGRT